MIRKRILRPTVRRIEKKNIVYAAMGFMFAAAEMYVVSLSYFFPLYRLFFAYGVGSTCLVVLALVMIFRKNVDKTSIILMILLLAVCACGILAGVLNGGSLARSLAWTMSLLLIPVFFAALGPDLPFAAVKGISLYCRIVLILYLISVVLFRENGMYLPEGSGSARNYYFLGHVNSSVKFALPALSVFAIADLWERGKIGTTTWIFNFLTLAAQFYTNAYVAAFGMCIYLLILLVFSKKGRLVGRFPKWLPLAVSVVIFSFIILTQRSAFQLLVMFAGRFDRSGSITSRGLIWNMGITAIENNQYGYGPFCDYSRLIHLGTYFPSSAHNLFLDAAIQTGIPGAVLFVIFLLLLMKNMPSWGKWPIIPAALFACATMWNFEPYFVEYQLQCTLLLLYLMFSLPREKGQV